MTTNLSLIQKISRYLYEPEASGMPQLITQDMVIDFYNMAINELCLDTDINYRQYIYTEATTSKPTTKTFVEITGSAETHLFSLSELLVKEENEDYYRQLWRTNMEDKLNIQEDATGWVNAVNIYDDSIKFSKGLEENDKIAISGRWKKAEQTASGNFPLHPMAESAVVYFAVANGFYVKGSIPTGDKWLAMYLNRKEGIQQFFQKLVKSNAPHAIRANAMANHPIKRNESVIVFPSVITV